MLLASGTGCVGGAIGEAASAALTPAILSGVDPTYAPITSEQTAALTALSMLAGGTLAGLVGANAQLAASSAANEALNNTLNSNHLEEEEREAQKEAKPLPILPKYGVTTTTANEDDSSAVELIGPGPLVAGLAGARNGANPTDNAPLGLGSTGLAVPNNLQEQLALQQAMSNPAAGVQLPIPLGDSRWPAADGWVKMSQNVNGVEIHYVRNVNSGAVDDFKFK